jgi:pyruvate,orthophosphate dikinase
MFNATDRLPIVVEMILARNLDERKIALDQLLPIQRQDFKDIFKTMSPRPVTVRLLDPPMHEFLPSEQTLVEDIETIDQYRRIVKGHNAAASILNLSTATGELGLDELDAALTKKERMLRKVRELYEVNPMLGHRGVRLGITYPEIYEMQIRAILEAAAECFKEGIEVHPEIMVPQVITSVELAKVKGWVDSIQAEVEAKAGVKLTFKFGSMVETVRACMRALQLAEIAEFFSFGTNDLTQATFSFSREDAENKFLPLYTEFGILEDNPFEVLDVNGVGVLMEMTVERGRKAKPDLKVGICGEAGGHPESIRFCHKIGLSYVSCSAPRVPIARLAAAHAKLLESKA